MLGSYIFLKSRRLANFTGACFAQIRPLVKMLSIFKAGACSKTVCQCDVTLASFLDYVNAVNMNVKKPSASKIMSWHRNRASVSGFGASKRSCLCVFL